MIQRRMASLPLKREALSPNVRIKKCVFYLTTLVSLTDFTTLFQGILVYLGNIFTTQLVSNQIIYSPKLKQNNGAIWMKTHLIKINYNFLIKCWKAVIKSCIYWSKKISLLYINSSTMDMENDIFLMNLDGANNQVHIYRYQQDNINYGLVKKQYCSMCAILYPLLLLNKHWFQGYEWDIVWILVF